MKHVAENAIMKVSHWFTFLVALSVVYQAAAQSDIPIGTWRTHFSYTDVARVAYLEDERKVYAATANALFYFDEEDNSINKLSKIDGLSDAGITSMTTNAAGTQVAIGYESGIIDFLDGNALFSFRDLAVAAQLEDRRIFDIEFHQSSIYIATSVGVVVLSDTDKEIRESYVEIGPNAATQPIADIALSADSIYLATPIGLLVAPLGQALNLQDFNNWSLKTPAIASANILQVKWLDNELWVTTGSALLSCRNGVWRDLTPLLTGGPYTTIRLSNTQRLVLAGDQSNTAVFNDGLVLQHTSAASIADAVTTSSGLYLSSKGSGLLRVHQGDAASILPQGPHTDRLIRLTYGAGRMYGISVYSDFLKRPLIEDRRYAIFEDNQWTTGQLAGISAPSSVSTGSQTFWGAYGQGVYNATQELLIDDQSAGSTLLPSPDGAFGPLITDVHHDSEGRLWVANYDADPSLHQLDDNGNGLSISLSAGTSARFPEQILSSGRTGAVWVRIAPDRGGGAYVYSSASQDVRYVTATTSGLPSTLIHDLAIDKNDEVWVATSRGVAFFQSSQSPFIPDFSDAIVPVFDGALLLKDVFCSAIAVDGGNRKWIGTPLGLWLFSENGDELIHHFTTTNSPLPSNQIEDIAIHPVSGEVFVVTDKGAASYRSDATDAGSTFSNVRVFPNPVTPGYQGTIGISGLASDVNVKITDISGRLVSEFFANGGTASWDGLDLYGQRVATGVYLIFSSDPLGEDTLVGKFAVVR